MMSKIDIMKIKIRSTTNELNYWNNMRNLYSTSHSMEHCNSRISYYYNELLKLEKELEQLKRKSS